MFPAPADTRFRGELHFEHRCGIGEHSVAEGTGSFGDAIAKRLQARTQHLVVIAPSGVMSDRGALRLRYGALGHLAQIVHSAGHDAQRARLQLGGASAQRAVALHVVHLAMPAAGEPFEEPWLGRRQVGIRDTDSLEAELPAPLLDPFAKPCVVHDDRS